MHKSQLIPNMDQVSCRGYKHLIFITVAPITTKLNQSSLFRRFQKAHQIRQAVLCHLLLVRQGISQKESHASPSTIYYLVQHPAERSPWPCIVLLERVKVIVCGEVWCGVGAWCRVAQ